MSTRRVLVLVLYGKSSRYSYSYSFTTVRVLVLYSTSLLTVLVLVLVASLSEATVRLQYRARDRSLRLHGRASHRDGLSSSRCYLNSDLGCMVLASADADDFAVARDHTSRTTLIPTCVIEDGPAGPAPPRLRLIIG